MIDGDIYNFLLENSGKIVAVGDTFDLKRSCIKGEKFLDYYFRVLPFACHIKYFIKGNHDSRFLDTLKIKHERNLRGVEYFKLDGILAFHGHQIRANYDPKRITKKEDKYDVEQQCAQLSDDLEEWACCTFNKFFVPKKKGAKKHALKVLNMLDAQNLLPYDVHTVIHGHTHLPYDVQVEFKGREYRVANCGSSLNNKIFNPIYIESLDLWFISDLHLGTKNTKLRGQDDAKRIQSPE